LAVTNALAYSAAILIINLKSFIGQAQYSKGTKCSLKKAHP